MDIIESCHSEGAKLELIQFVTVTIRTLIKKDLQTMAFGANVSCSSASRKTRQAHFIVTDSMCWVYWPKLRFCCIPPWVCSKQRWLQMLFQSQGSQNANGLEWLAFGPTVSENKYINWFVKKKQKKTRGTLTHNRLTQDRSGWAAILLENGHWRMVNAAVCLPRRPKGSGSPPPSHPPYFSSFSGCVN